MARGCADYMNKGDTLFKDLREALKESHKKNENF